jgi:hypothetical protein
MGCSPEKAAAHLITTHILTVGLLKGDMSSN